MSKTENRDHRLIRKKYRCSPLWATRIRDRTRHLSGVIFSQDKFSLADQVKSLSCQPLFIVSAGRSGTTLLRSMLVASGSIAIPPETQVIHTVIRRFAALQYLGWADLSRLIVALFESHPLFYLWEVDFHPVYQTSQNLHQNERSLARLIDEVFLFYAANHFPDARVWGDQSPLNTFYLPWVLQVFPKARYLHLVRDGRDVIASLIEKGLSLEEATERWVISVERAQKLKTNPDQISFLEMRYETLVNHPIESLQQICKFIKIGYDNSMLDYWKSPTTIEHKHFNYHRNLGKPVFDSSIGRWKERLTEKEQIYVLSKTSKLLEILNYQD